MKLYYSPLACSLSDHIALEESGAPYERERVDLAVKRTASGSDFLTINPKGYVPTLVLDGGQTLTENVAVLDWIATQHPRVAVPGPLGRTRVIEALAYISSEIHKSYEPLFHPSDEAEAAGARALVARRLDYFAGRLAGDFLFGQAPSVADFYLFVMLLWTTRFKDDPIPIAPPLAALRSRMLERPTVQAAMREEGIWPLQRAA